MAATPGLVEHFAAHRRLIAGWTGQHAVGASTVMDLACGTGEFTALAVSLLPQARVTGLDISTESLARARQRLSVDESSRVDLVCADFWSRLPERERADLVLCLDAIHHLGDVRTVLRRIRECVAPGGLVVGNVWTADGFHDFGRHRYGHFGHLRRSAVFLAAAALIRMTGGRIGSGVYRTQLITAAHAKRLVTEELGDVIEMRQLRYHLVFACRPKMDATKEMVDHDS